MSSKGFSLMSPSESLSVIDTSPSSSTRRLSSEDWSDDDCELEDELEDELETLLLTSTSLLQIWLSLLDESSSSTVPSNVPRNEDLFTFLEALVDRRSVWA